MEVTSSAATATKLSGAPFLSHPPVEEEHATCSVSVGNPSYLVSEFLSASSSISPNTNVSTQNGRLLNSSANPSVAGGSNFDFEGIDLNSEVPLGEILEKLQESSSSSSIISSSSSEEDDLKKSRLSQINNNVIQLHAEKEDLNGTTISATVNVATLDLSDPEAIHRHLSQLNDTVLKVIPNPNPPTRFLQSASSGGGGRSNRRSSSGGKSSPQVCGICSKVFSNASALAKHRLTHSEERRYHCSICGKAFKRQDHLNGHLLTHRSTKPFACTVEGCGKSYCDARSLRRHKENHHPLAPEVARSNAAPNNLPPNSNNLLDSIKFSGKGLTPQQFQLIEQIIKESKEGAAAAAAIAAGVASPAKILLPNGTQQPVECAICGRKFKNIPALNGHMRLHGGYYKKDADGRRIPSLTEAALLQQQSLSEKNPPPSAGKRVQQMAEGNENSNSSNNNNTPGGIGAFRSLPPPDTTKLLANLERKAIELQSQPRQSLNSFNNEQPKKRRKKTSSESETFLPRAPLPPAVKQQVKSNATLQVVLKFQPDKSPKIGPEHQVSNIPEPSNKGMEEEEEELSEEEEEGMRSSLEDRLLWSPKYATEDKEEELSTYLTFARSSGVTRAERRTTEFALYTLMRHKGDTKSALQDLLLDVKVDEKELSMGWTDREVGAFFNGLSEYQKDFRALSSVVGTKSTAQCVEFYYFWKNLRLNDQESSSPSTPGSNQATATTLINGSITTIGDPLEQQKGAEVASLPSIHGILY